MDRTGRDGFAEFLWVLEYSGLLPRLAIRGKENKSSMSLVSPALYSCWVAGKADSYEEVSSLARNRDV